MKRATEIPDEITEIMTYLAADFAKSMKDPVNGAEDLHHDLVILYLEEMQAGEKSNVKDKSDPDHWFTFFRSRLTNKYNRVQNSRRILDSLKKEAK